MITEDYVSFEIAKLLKEKGFDERICHWYDDEEFLHKNTGLYLCNSAELDGRITAPTLQMAMKWLREEKHIFIELLVDTMIKSAFTWRLFEYPSMEIMPYDGWEYTYEKACETAIKYCLENLI